MSEELSDAIKDLPQLSLMMQMAIRLKAAIGFARGKGLDVADLVVEDGYIYAETKTAGVKAMDIFTQILPELIHGLSFPKSMHWGDLDDKFIRPVRWILALLGTAVISGGICRCSFLQLQPWPSFLR